MIPTYVFAGKIKRDILLPPFSAPQVDVPGGEVLYAATGALVWDKGAGILSRVGEDYPRQWITQMGENGLLTAGVSIQPEAIDLRNFISYSEAMERHTNNPLAHFRKRELPLPKILLGYQRSTPNHDPWTFIDPASSRPADIPIDYLDAHLAHFCAMEYATTSRLISAFAEAGATTMTLDPHLEWMDPNHWEDVIRLINGLTAFLPSEEELRLLFRGKSTDLVEMAEEMGKYCELVVIKRGAQGQLLYDSLSHKCWHIPAYPVNLVDPTGAGAAFCGGFLAGYHKTFDPLRAVLHGSVSASLCIEGSGIYHCLGCHPSLPLARLMKLQEGIHEI